MNKNMHLLSRLLMLLAAAALAVESFQVSPKTSTSRNLSTKRFSSSPLKSKSTGIPPAWITRPYKEDVSRDKLMLDGEFAVGRVATVGASAMLA
mmetsp:Transcript_4118/g.5405  ORF Transcript_4118/g.5405 Transcript_4118/m.5405 type:complete len:94 (+) Transcript_4118:46-327(+)